ncbi:MAG: hypothetical protein WBO36_01265, partial [Saprospiraceae bacterium]
QSGLNPTSTAWWTDLIVSAAKKRNFYEAYKDKWKETFDNWENLSANVKVMHNALRNDVIRAEMWRNFSLVFASAVSKAGTSLNKWGQDILFINGSYDAGYGHGKLAFDIIPAGWLFTVGKGAIGAAKVSKNIVGEIAENISKSMDGPTARKALKESIVDLSELATKLITRPRLKAWFDLDMPAWVKLELDRFSKNPNMTKYLDGLEKRLGESPAIKNWLKLKGKDGLDAWRYLEDVHPSTKWCLLITP